MSHRRVPAAVVAVAGCLMLAGCVTSHGTRPNPASTVTHKAPEPAPTGPIGDGPTTSAAGTCTLLPAPTVAGDVGMRLARVTVQRSGGKQVGCTFYALQHPTAQCDTTCLAGERLPGPHQPAVRLSITRYADATAAHNAMVRLAEAGTNPQQVDVGGGRIGLAYQTRFYGKDGGKDWACAVNVDATLAVVETVTTGTSFNAVALAKHLAKHLAATLS